MTEQDENQTLEQENTDSSEQNQGAEPTVESVTEAVLFASDEPLTPARLADIVGTNVKQLREHIENLNQRYEANNSSFRIEQIAGGYQMLTLSCYNHWLKRLLRARDESKLSPAALETLAIVAYKQPVIRPDIDAIRGVNSDSALKTLLEKDLVAISGRDDGPGRPLLYRTTSSFLKYFGLNNLQDLPDPDELAAILGVGMPGEQPPVDGEPPLEPEPQLELAAPVSPPDIEEPPGEDTDEPDTPSWKDYDEEGASGTAEQ